MGRRVRARDKRNQMLSQPNKPVGLVGYGAYIPRFRLPGAENQQNLER